MKVSKAALFGLALAWAVGATSVYAAEQFIHITSYNLGPYAAGGSGIGGGWTDYLQLINERDGGINGVKLVWESCETEYNTARGVECYERLKNKHGGLTLFNPLSTGVAYAVIDRAPVDKMPIIMPGYGRSDASDGRVFPWVFPLITNFWSQSTAVVRFIGMKEGGLDKLKGKKFVNLHHDTPAGKETIPALEAQAKMYGFQVTHLPVTHPGLDQQSQWLQVRQINPDWVVMEGWGVMNSVALKTAAKVGFPREKIIGWWWSGAEEDVVPAGDAARGYITAGFHGAGSDYPVIKEIQKYVVAKGKSDMKDKSRIGSIYYNRGVAMAFLAVEAIRTAQEKFGKGQRVTGEQIRWGIEHLEVNEKKLKALGVTGLVPPFKVTCADHEGSGRVKFQQWDGKQWNIISDWVEADRELVRRMVEESAQVYAKEKGITLRDCSKES